MSCAGCEDCTLTQIAEKMTPFEIHITVHPDTNITEFKRACAVMGDVKPLVIANVIDDDLNVKIDIMTRSTVVGDTDKVGDELFRVYSGLNDRGFDILRNKVETVPWAYEKLKNFSREKNVPYFETHIEILGYESVRQVYLNAKQYGGYLSWNVDKENVLMVTFRMDHVTEAEFATYTDRMRDNLERNGLVIGRKIVEFAFHDDNKAHDDAWVNAA